MNILIINAFGNSSSGKQKFNSFFNLIKQIFKKVSVNSGIETFNYIIRNPSELEDYIFNFYSNPTDETSESQNRKNFNSLDIVFVDGIEYYSPWKKRSHCLTKFIELCKLSNKVLFAGGVAFEILIYYLSIGAINDYNIINSQGEIKALEEINKIPLKYLKGIKKNELFLDFVTGDLLEYRNNDNYWEPIMNIRLYHQISAEKYLSRGKFVLKEGFKGKDYIKNEFALKTYCQEIKIKITRQYVSNYLVKNCPIEFIGICSLEWFPHFVNVTAKKLQFKTICQSDKGPIVIEHENSIGVAFHSDEKFKDSVKILVNFIKKKFNEVKDKLLKIKNIKFFISTNTNNEINQVFKIFKDNDDKLRGKFDPDEEIPSNPYSLLGKVVNSCLFNRTKKIKHEAKHVGEGINNREMIFVENNYINQKPFFRLKKSHNQRKENKTIIPNNKINHIKYFSSFDKKKRLSLGSNTSKINKSLATVNSFKNRRNIISLDKHMQNRGSTTIKRKKRIKDLIDIDDINSQNQSKRNYLKLKTYSSNNDNKFETLENNNNGNNNIDEDIKLQLKKLIMPKNTYNNDNDKQSENEDEIGDFNNYESKYPRLPTLNELGYLFNKTKKFNLNLKKNKFENDKKDSILNYNSQKALFMKKSININLKSDNHNNEKNNDKNNDKKFMFKSNLVIDDNERKNSFINKPISIYKTVNPMVNKKYDIDNNFEE